MMLCITSPRGSTCLARQITFCALIFNVGVFEKTLLFNDFSSVFADKDDKAESKGPSEDQGIDTWPSMKCARGERINSW